MYYGEFFSQEITEGKPPVVRTIYLQKWALGNPPPEKVKVTVEEEKA